MTSTMSSTRIGRHALRRAVVVALLGFTGGTGGAAPAHAATRGGHKRSGQHRRPVRAASARHRA
jgi:hypothetical protein